MARQKKDRSEEVQVVFSNLKYLSFDELKQVVALATKRMESKKKEAIETKKAQIAALQAELTAMEG